MKTLILTLGIFCFCGCSHTPTIVDNPAELAKLPTATQVAFILRPAAEIFAYGFLFWGISGGSIFKNIKKKVVSNESAPK